MGDRHYYSAAEDAAMEILHPETMVVPGEKEIYQGRLREVVDPRRQGWWRFHKHYDRGGYCDNPARGY
ncbi:hypothetical protein [Mesorhizobium sp. M0767]|uniref:hypothetical protein n=1 Tax=Mesorhizobium sp. M0767 TaxID=2956995 RepID=UPI00333925E5